MKLFLASDLHVEFHGDIPDAAKEAEVILLLGDCNSGIRSFDVAEEYHSKYKVPVVFVAGNHEFYGHDLDITLRELKKKSAQHPHIYFLEQDTVTLKGVRFLGCTLWSNFSLFGSDTRLQHKNIAQEMIPDFRLIKKGENLFTADDAEQLFYSSFNWLKKSLAEPFAGKTVVLTHFAPDICAVHPQYLQSGKDLLTPYFTSDCTDLIKEYAIHTWCYGHTHNSIDEIKLAKTRIVSNQRGYPHEPNTFTQFDPTKLIHIV